MYLYEVRTHGKILVRKPNASRVNCECLDMSKKRAVCTWRPLMETLPSELIPSFFQFK